MEPSSVEHSAENSIHLAKLFDVSHLINDYLVPFGLKIVTAIIIWVVGSIIINTLAKVALRALHSRKMEPTLASYASSALHIVLRMVLIMIIMEVCGIQTTSFAAILGAAGVAIGVAWSGLLSNFAAGIFLVFLRPFKVGDYITVAGQSGTVTEIGLFITRMNTSNNIVANIGNNKVFSDVIINYSANENRVGTLQFQTAHGVDIDEVIAIIIAEISKVPGVLETPAPTVTIASLNATGVAFNINMTAKTKEFWPAYYESNKVLARLYVKNNWPVPSTYQVSINQEAK